MSKIVTMPDCAQSYSLDLHFRSVTLTSVWKGKKENWVFYLGPTTELEARQCRQEGRTPTRQAAGLAFCTERTQAQHDKIWDSKHGFLLGWQLILRSLKQTIREERLWHGETAWERRPRAGQNQWLALCINDVRSHYQLHFNTSMVRKILHEEGHVNMLCF